MADLVAVTLLLEQVTDVIKSYPNLISGAEKEFKKVRDDVQELKNILVETANTWSEDYRYIKNQIQKVVYEVGDAIDTWLTELKAKYRLVRGVTNFKFAKKVKSLREGQVKYMLEKAKQMKTALQSDGTSVDEDQVQERRMEGPPIRQERVVGLKDEEEKIKGFLMTNQEELDIISIIGRSGLGKTTLAWKVFRDEIISYEFPIRIWVNFSQRFNSKDVLIQIMKHFTNNIVRLYSMTSRELCHMVHAYLSRDKFLLVVDNVWKTEHWDAIKDALPYNNGNGKVMITSRDLEVGRHAKRITEPHEQRLLNQRESWELFQLEVFGEFGNCPDILEHIGSFIANNCEGLPHTIVVIGSVLRDQYLGIKSDVLVREKWMEVATNNNQAIEDKNKVLLDIVALSYSRLPERLRNCFLYLGVFPADYKIPASTLIQLWIAEGFIYPDGERSSEKIAEENLNELISSNLLTVHKMNPMQEVKVCLVEDIMRMFCAYEAKKHNLFNNIRTPKESNASLKASKMEMIHRLCLHFDPDEFFSAKLKGPCVRSFLCFQEDAIELNSENDSAIFESFPNLRILQSQTIKFRKFPPMLIKLNHLRYIVLCVSELEILPSQISLLWNLQTIIVHTNSKSLTMKASLWKMINLRHLKTRAAIVLEKEFVEGDQAGDNIQTLYRLAPESVLQVSQRARNLKTLGVCGKLAPLFDDMPLGNLDHLEKLKLYQVEVPKNRFKHLPNSNCFPPTLKRLTLSGTFLDWKHMSTLANIQGLEVLKLKENAFIGLSWEAEKHNCFSKLQALHMQYLNLVVWTASDSTFPCLRHLELKSCDDLNAIPDDKLRCLKSMDIGRVRKRVADSVKNLEVKLGVVLMA